MLAPKVLRVAVDRTELTAERVPALKELYSLDRLPLAESRVELEIKGVPTAVVNALRRAAIDEMPGHALRVPADGWDTALTTEAFMVPQFVDKRIALIPLRPQISAEVVEGLRLDLDVTNDGTSVRSVYAGDLVIAAGAMPAPLFNPTFELATVQPGRRLVIRGIHIAAGVGRDYAAFQVARRAALRHLDIERYGEKDTHEEGGTAVDESGYKLSSLVADPRHHVLSAVIPATTAPSEAVTVFADACAHIKERLSLVASAVGRAREAEPLPGGVQYTVVQLEAGLSEAILQLPGETYTVGEVLRRVVYETVPDVAFVAYVVVDHEDRLRFTLRHSDDVTKILLNATRVAIETFDRLRAGIAAARH